MEDLYKTHANRETCPRSCKLYGFHQAAWPRSYRSGKCQPRKISSRSFMWKSMTCRMCGQFYETKWRCQRAISANPTINYSFDQHITSGDPTHNDRNPTHNDRPCPRAANPAYMLGPLCRRLCQTVGNSRQRIPSLAVAWCCSYVILRSGEIARYIPCSTFDFADAGQPRGKQSVSAGGCNLCTGSDRQLSHASV